MINFTPTPAIEMGFLKLSVHGLIMAIAFFTAVVLARREARRRGLSADIVDNAAIIAVVFGLLGARLVYYFTLGREMDLFEALEIWHGGLSSHGGYVFGIIAGLAYLKFKKVGVRKYADTVIPYMLVGWAIGRLGCFLNWDSFGKITSVPWSFIVYGEARHATQLYEAFGYTLAFFAVRAFVRSRSLARFMTGFEAVIALMVFSAVRFIVDFFRDDMYQYLLMSRILTVSIIVFGALFIVFTSDKDESVV